MTADGTGTRRLTPLTSAIAWATLFPLAGLPGMALAQSPDGDVPEVVVTDRPDQEATGTEEDGYRRTRADMGPLGSRKILDTPYSVTGMSGALMENLGARTLSDVIKYFPSAQIEARGGIDVGRPQTRGFEADIIQNTRMDGMNVFGVTPYPMEQLDNLEILNGLSGALYGPAAPAGTFNYILKRPTDQATQSLRVGFDSDGVWTTHGDAGGRVGVLGYRLNLLHADGESYVDGSNLRRELVSGNFDIHLSDDTVVELNGSRYIHDAKGFPGGFSYSQTSALPSAPDPTKSGYGQDYAGQDLRTDTLSMKVKHQFSGDWKVTAGYLRQDARRDLRGVTNTLAANGEDYTTRLSTMQTGTTKIDSTMLYLNGKTRAFGFDHDLVLGSNGYWHRQFYPTDTQGSLLGNASLSNPALFGEPAWQDLGPDYKAQENRQQTVVVGDTITIDEQWSVLAAASQDWLQGHSWNSTGAHTSSYREAGISPTASLMFKPIPNATLYVTYADSLQKGDAAPLAGVSNPGEVQAPYRSEQWEVGAKATVGRTDLTAALFRIKRPFAYTVDGVFKEQGEQVNRGVELTAKGKVIDNLTLFGGVTLLDPKLTDTGNANTSNQQVVGVPRIQANLYAEYALDHVPGLTLDANLHHTGRRAANDANTTWAESYTTLDLGARYVDDLWGEKLTWRLAVNNVFDERYWASVFPSSINGTNAGNPSAFLGSPRTVAASVQITF